MVWLEVETKVALNENEIPDLRKRILKIARLEKIGIRGDDYFAIKAEDYPKKAFRIRNKGEIHEINFKRWLTNLWSNDIVVKEEFEFEIKTKNLNSFIALMKDLGFVEWMKKIKHSESYRYSKNKKVDIEINKVKHLGYFMEIEYLCPRSEMEKAKKTIRRILKNLNINPDKIDNTGYTKMLWYKGIKDKRYFMAKKVKLD
jgi:predicted adenylyl cyclase CyaB